MKQGKISTLSWKNPSLMYYQLKWIDLKKAKKTLAENPFPEKRGHSDEGLFKNPRKYIEHIKKGLLTPQTYNIKKGDSGVPAPILQPGLKGLSEGRHRLLAAEELGATTIPVAIPRRCKLENFGFKEVKIKQTK